MSTDAVRVEVPVDDMSEDQRISYLYRRGWQCESDGLWIAKNGFAASFTNAVRLQQLADQERPT